MARVKSVSEYIATQPKALQPTLRRVRGIIRKAVPEAEEIISYQIPAYRLHRRIVVFFAGWAKHFSLYPAGDPLVEKFGKELARYEIRRGTIRFPLDQPIPAKLIARIAKYRAQKIIAGTKKAPASRPARRKAVKRARR